MASEQICDIFLASFFISFTAFLELATEAYEIQAWFFNIFSSHLGSRELWSIEMLLRTPWKCSVAAMQIKIVLNLDFMKILLRFSYFNRQSSAVYFNYFKWRKLEIGFGKLGSKKTLNQVYKLKLLEFSNLLKNCIGKRNWDGLFNSIEFSRISAKFVQENFTV